MAKIAKCLIVAILPSDLQVCEPNVKQKRGYLQPGNALLNLFACLNFKVTDVDFLPILHSWWKPS
jgi:hypothetical protein